MKQIDSKFAFFFIILAIQLACEQTTVSRDNNQTVTVNTIQANSNFVVNGIAEQKKEVDYFAHIIPEHKGVLQEWIRNGKSCLRPATEATNSILDKSSLEDVHENSKTQFYNIADFNKDGKEDFAVLLIDTRGKKDEDKFALAIFNGSFKKGQAPNYYQENLRGISNSYLDFGGKAENYLYLGVYESDRYCISYIPKGNTYKFKDCM